MNFAALSSRVSIGFDAIGLGDEVFMQGLYSRHWGDNGVGIEPIIRTGVVASSSTKILRHSPAREALDLIGDREVYLLEIRLIGGLSGSPVTALLDKAHYENLRMEFPDIGEPGPVYRGLGIISGHWDEEEGTSLLNSGIAYVTPMWKVREVIESKLGFGLDTIGLK